MESKSTHQYVVIMVGYPGSGKTTVAQSSPKLVRVSQDDLGSKDECVKRYKEALSKGQSVVVDRTNIDRRQRKLWIGLAREAGVTDIRCIFMDIPEEECVRRARSRKGHPTIVETTTLDKIKKIVHSFRKSLELPSLEEGFTSIYRYTERTKTDEQ